MDLGLLLASKPTHQRGAEEQEIADISTVCFEGSSERLREVRRPNLILEVFESWHRAAVLPFSVKSRS